MNTTSTAGLQSEAARAYLAQAAECTRIMATTKSLRVSSQVRKQRDEYLSLAQAAEHEHLRRAQARM